MSIFLNENKTEDDIIDQVDELEIDDASAEDVMAAAALAGMFDESATDQNAVLAAASVVEEMCRTQALESATYFEGGDTAVQNFCEQCEVVDEEFGAIQEARKMAKNTYVRLSKNDDFHRRQNMACLVLAKQANDPLFKKLAENRRKERALRSALFKKYGARAKRVANLSQRKHIKDMRKMPALPKIKF